MSYLDAQKVSVRRYAYVVLGSLFAASGCDESALKGLVNVAGVVEYNGKPVTTGQVVFLPAKPGVGRQASGALDSEGRFELSSVQGGDGVMPAEYDIVVLAFDKPPGEPTREEIEALGGKPWRTPIVPDRYTDADKTDLRETITSDHSGMVRLILQD